MKIKIKIDKNIYTFIPEFNIVAYRIKFKDKDYNKVQELLFSLKLNYSNPLDIPKVKETRDIYKKIGVDPSHTRCSVEALDRRLIKQNLYTINSVVDLGNILSIMTQRSVCVVDYNKLKGDVLIRLGQDGERVDAINRSSINMKGIVCYIDDEGIFGSTTSDSERTKVENNTLEVLVMVICFSKQEDENEKLLDLFNNYLYIEEMNQILTE